MNAQAIKELITNRKVNYFKAGGALVMAVYGIICARDVTVPRFLDGVDLVIHEAGHLLFRWFGEFLQVLGGTVGQLFVPAAFTVYFHLRREFFSSAVTFFWCGQNLFNISVYIKDAQAMALPLVSVGGGEDTIHDWNYLLSKVGLLRWDHGIGNLVYLVGLLVMIASVVWGFYHSTEGEKAALS
jgi:hypothetical protein